MATAERVAWIDIAKGFCIVAVVSMYALDRVEAAPGAGGWMEAWVRFARPFRMPDFFLISGLFLSRVIDRPWEDYLDKKAVHYLYFFALWTLITFPFLVLAGKAGPTPVGALAYLVRMFYEPYAMLWFLQMLAIYFMMARLLRGVPVWAVMTAALLWQMYPAMSSWKQFNRVGERFIYFYAGYAFAPIFFRLAQWARERRRTAMLGLAAWAGVNGLLVSLKVSGYPGIGAALGFMGAGAVITASSLLSDLRFAGWLRYLGERSIAIYLSFLLPMGVFLLGANRIGGFDDRGDLAVVLTVLSVLSSLALDRLTRGTALGFLFERPSWAILKAAPAHSDPSSAAVSSSADTART